ncbi:MAG: STAS domain-containing protein [Leptospiraceae bacterium]
MNDPARYELEVLPWPNALLVRARGNLDIYTSPEFRLALDDSRKEGKRHFILDLSGVDYIDSTGLGSLASFMDAVKKEKGSLRLSGLRGVVHKAFVFTNLLDLFSVHESVEGALESMGKELS